MALDHSGIEIADVNLDDYFLDNRFYNTYTYVHKKFLNKGEVKKESRKDTEMYSKINEESVLNKSHKNDLEENLNNDKNEMKKVRKTLHDNALIEQTVKFAKDLAPIVIPPSREFSPTPVIYTIKTSKKHGKKISKSSTSHIEYAGNAKSEKSKCKNKVYENKLRTKKIDIHSDHCLREVASHSSDENTLDEFHINQSSNFSESEIFEQNSNKMSQNVRKRKHEEKNNAPLRCENSLEAIATEIDTTNQANIKIHLMNDTEKNLFYENLTVPIIKTVKEYLNETNKPTEIYTDMQSLKQSLECNTEKLDYLVQILTNVEKKIMNYSDKCTKIIMSPKDISSKTSRLEELAEDLFENNEETSIDPEVNHDKNLNKKTMITKSAVVTMSLNHGDSNKTGKSNENFAHVEKVPIHTNATCIQLGVKPDGPNRIPARFCWTDTSKKF